MFQFKEFSVVQDRSAMKVGTDGVLLGAWVQLRGDERRILDVGSGTGLIALMLAQRTECAAIDGVELDAASCEEAAMNCEASPWGDRLTMHRADIQSYDAPMLYDLIVSNPPFFVDSLLSPAEERSNARHTTQLSFSDLVASVCRLMHPEGRFALVLPTTEQQLFDREAEGRLRLLRRCDVRGGVRSVVKRQLSEYSLFDNSENSESSEASYNDTLRHEELTLRDADGAYSAEYRALTSEFYLKF